MTILSPSLVKMSKMLALSLQPKKDFRSTRNAAGTLIYLCNSSLTDSVRWETVPFVGRNVPPPSGTLEDARMTLEASANWFSLLYFSWMTPMMVLGQFSGIGGVDIFGYSCNMTGYARPLEAVDLWKLQDKNSAGEIGRRITESFRRRHEAAETYNARLKSGEISPSLYKRLIWKVRGNAKEREEKWRTKDGLQKPSLTMAMNDACFWWFWVGGIVKLIGDIAQMTSPLLVKEIILFAQRSFVAHRAGQPVPAIGVGVGLTFALLAQQLLGSVCLHQSFYRGSTTGVVSKPICIQISSHSFI